MPYQPLAYQPIENYGLIGNMRTTALVGLNGSIDWFCHPRHDSPSIFGAILDSKKGGHFKIVSTVEGDRHKQFYYPETNILITRFLCEDGVGEVVDFMPLGNAQMRNWVIRQVRTIRKEITFRAECYPAFNYGRSTHTTAPSPMGVVFSGDDNPCLIADPSTAEDDAEHQCQFFELITDVPMQINKRGAFAEFLLKEGETATFIFKPNLPTLSEEQFDCLEETTAEFFEETTHYWRKWLSQCVYTGRWRRQVERSALALKLLTYEPTGAIIAAPTTSLPEDIGGERNWDYRYTWIRDAAFTVYALMRIGFTDEAKGFMRWLEARCQELGGGGSLEVMYRIDGRLDLEEEHLDHLEGYKQSGPVRIGNGAFDQVQLDICGELMDSVYLFNKYGDLISHDFWTHLRYLTNWVCDHWNTKDQGVWESRGGPKHHVYSKLMCWVAVDRALRIAENRSFPAERSRWITVRDEIYEQILDKGWDDERQAFVQAYGEKDIDAGCLIMPLVFFMAPNDPKMLKTIEAVRKPPREG
ncbi:MAG: glycoside hydrolase family 15 protein, partial [Cyanobacteria bacterium J06555_13]